MSEKGDGKSLSPFLRWSTKMKKILVIGSTVADVTISLDHLPEPEEDIIPGAQKISLGGCAFNVSNMLRLFRVPYTLFSPVGTGIYGDFVKKELEKYDIRRYAEREGQPAAGIDMEALPYPQEENGCCYCLVDKTGNRTFMALHGAEYRFRKEWFSRLNMQEYDRIYVCGLEIEEPTGEQIVDFLEICREHDVTISLGDACRPGCLADATDGCQIEELLRLGELTQRAWDRDVQVMVEGPGHVPMDQIAANMKVQQTICKGAPFYVLGPLVTDIAPGYDHITAAIGGAIAAASGAAFLCYVTPAEHLALPDLDDVRQGIIASRIAAHAADIAKGIPGARQQDDRMADARRKLDWEAQWLQALDPETARKIRDSRAPEDDHSDTCSMCGKFCAVRSMNKALAGEQIDIL